MSNSIPRESVEFQGVPVTVDKVVVTTGIKYAITLDGVRPTVWTDAVILGGKTGFMITGLTTGRYRVWAKVSSSPETPVIDAGYLTIT